MSIVVIIITTVSKVACTVILIMSILIRIMLITIIMISVMISVMIIATITIISRVVGVWITVPVNVYISVAVKYISLLCVGVNDKSGLFELLTPLKWLSMIELLNLFIKLIIKEFKYSYSLSKS